MGDQYEKAMSATWKYFEEHWEKNHRTPGAAECVNFIWNFLKLPHEEEPKSKVVDAFEDSVLVHPPKIIPGVEQALEKLADKYPLGLISDTGFSPGTILKELMSRNNLDKYFTSFSFSNETGVSKPNEKAFQTALEPLGQKPENGLHIGDIEGTDIVGAKNLGMTAIRFTGSVNEYVIQRNSKETIADHEFETWSQITDLVLS
jgi:putative hydrolase of the HAD superfamily